MEKCRNQNVNTAAGIGASRLLGCARASPSEPPHRPEHSNHELVVRTSHPALSSWARRVHSGPVGTRTAPPGPDPALSMRPLASSAMALELPTRQGPSSGVWASEPRRQLQGQGQPDKAGLAPSCGTLSFWLPSLKINRYANVGTCRYKGIQVAVSQP